jgi:hypothetical protein
MTKAAVKLSPLARAMGLENAHLRKQVRNWLIAQHSLASIPLQASTRSAEKGQKRREVSQRKEANPARSSRKSETLDRVHPQTMRHQAQG